MLIIRDLPEIRLHVLYMHAYLNTIYKTPQDTPNIFSNVECLSLKTLQAINTTILMVTLP